MRKAILILTVFTAVLFSASAGYSADSCKASFVNPLTDVRWDGIFPIEIAGVEVKGPDDDIPNPDSLNSVICMCKRNNNLVMGISVSYWEPARVVEITKVPYCFPLLGGMKLKEPNPGSLQGTVNTNTPYTKANAHWYLFSVWNLLDLFVDVGCTPFDGFDIAYMTEIDPLWNDDMVGFLLNPEALLFANPVAQLACMADSVSSTMGWPLDSLYWCMGTWGSAYPLTGGISESRSETANAGLAARMIYKMNRELLTWDTGVDKCGAVLTPVWIKSHYKIQQMKPVRGKPMPIGQAPLLWEANKNPAFGTGSNAPDNYDWMIFRRVKCCIGKSVL